jgi:hypothetical protein
MPRFHVPPAPLCPFYRHASLLIPVDNLQVNDVMPRATPAHASSEEGADGHVQRENTAQQHRAVGGDGAVAGRVRKAGHMAAAFRQLMEEFENLSNEQESIIAQLQEEASLSGQESKHREARIDRVESDLRRCLEELRDATTQVDKQADLLDELKDDLKLTREMHKQADVNTRTLQEKVRRRDEALEDAKEESRAARETKLNQAATIAALQDDLDKTHETASAVKVTVDFQSSKIIDLENELQEARLCAKTSEQVASAEQAKALKLETELQRAYESGNNMNETIQSQHGTMVVLEAHLSEASASREANCVIIQDLSAKLKTSTDALSAKTEECLALELEKDNLQNTCTNYASVIAIATHHLSGAGQSVSEGAPHRDDETPDVTSADYSAVLSPLPLGARYCNDNSNCSNVEDNPENLFEYDGAQKTRKFQFRVDVPPFQPNLGSRSSRTSDSGLEVLVEQSSSPSGSTTQTQDEAFTVCHDGTSSYPNLFWCPPGTSTNVLVSTAYSSDSENVHVIDIATDSLSHEDALWSYIWPVLQRSSGSRREEVEHRSENTSNRLRAVLSDIAMSAEDALPPVLVVMRDAGLLAPSKLSKNSQRGRDAIAVVSYFVDVLASAHKSLETKGVMITVILEGWPSAIPVGVHTTRSLALPRVGRKQGRSKRGTQAGRHDSICFS